MAESLNKLASEFLEIQKLAILKLQEMNNTYYKRSKGTKGRSQRIREESALFGVNPKYTKIYRAQSGTWLGASP